MGFDMGSLTRALDATPKDPLTDSKKTISEAIQFVKTVKREFEGERGKYEEFLNVLRDFRVGSISFADVTNRMKVLLAGHPDLVRGFNMFMPHGTKLDQEAAEEAPAAGVATAE